ncbi:MAG TPA: sugar ABC transporter permease [Actinomycetes bacterium]|jgi:multiple sugar transport system permease protein
MADPVAQHAAPARPALARARAGRREASERRLSMLLLWPVLGVIFAIAAYPFALAVKQSLSAQTGEFIGLRNYSRALHNPLLYDALTATGLYAVLVLPTEILLGLGLALLVHRMIRSTAARAAIFVMAVVPLVVPPVAVGVIARLFYAPGYGVINQVLVRSGITDHEIGFLSHPFLAMLSVASVDVWQWTAFVYLVLFAGLQTVPREMVEAARVDGAGGWALFRHIEFNYLRSLLVLILFFRVADVLRVFDHIFILTGGGPGSSTQLLSLYLYRIEFKFFDDGQAAALAVTVLVVVSILYSLVTRVLPVEKVEKVEEG